MTIWKGKNEPTYISLSFLRIRVQVLRAAFIIASVAVFAVVCTAQTTDANQVARASESQFTVYAGPALRIATAISVILGLVKAISEWSTAGKTTRQMERVIRLSRFIEAINANANGQSISSKVVAVERQAKAEMEATLARVYSRPKPLSRWRQFLLLYIPTGPRAFIAHFLFFSLTALGVFGIVSTIQDVFNSSFEWGELAALIVIFTASLAPHRWAALEWRRSKMEILKPVHLPLGLHWFPPQSLFGLIANIWLLLEFFWIPFAAVLWEFGFQFSNVPEVVPRWESTCAFLLSGFSLPLAYFWARTEYKISSGELHRNSRSLLRSLMAPRSVQGAVGTVAFVAISAWLIIDVIDIRILPSMSSLDITGSGYGFVCAEIIGFVIGMVFSGVLPWLAVYRGLSEIFPNPGKEREAHFE